LIGTPYFWKYDRGTMFLTDDLEMRNVQPLALPHHLFTTLALIEQAFGHSRPTEE
jgi:hypothetical protein